MRKLFILRPMVGNGLFDLFTRNSCLMLPFFLVAFFITPHSLVAQATSCPCQGGQYAKIELLYTGPSGVSVNTFRNNGLSQAYQNYPNVQTGQVIIVDANGLYNNKLANTTYIQTVSGGCTSNCPVTQIPTQCNDANIGVVYGDFTLIYTEDKFQQSCTICDLDHPWMVGGNTVLDDCNELGTLGPNDLVIITNGIEKMRITSGGQVGIGTNAPTNTLDVNGDVRVRNMQNDNTLNKVVVEDANGVLKYRDASSIIQSGDGDGLIYDAPNSEIDVNPGDGIAINNDQVEVNASDLDGAGTSISNNNINVNTDNSTIEIDGNDNLRVVAEGITANEIATGAVTTSEILDGTIQTSDVQPGANNTVLVTDANGNVSWDTQGSFIQGADGDGLVYDAGNTELDVNPGDGIAVNNDQVEVVASDIEGNGVVVTNNNIDVNPGDGIAVNNDQVEVVASDIEGNGVVVNNNNIDVNPGDGIAINNDQVEVNASDLDGAGTSISNNNINVNTDNSTIEIDGNDNLRVVAEGITANEIATGAVTTSEILDGTILPADIASGGLDKVLVSDSNGFVVWDNVSSVFSGQEGDGLIYDNIDNEIDVNPGDGIRVDQDKVRVEAKDLIGIGLTSSFNNLDVVYGSTVGTSVQGNTQITIDAGKGLQTGGTITLGSGGTVTLNVGDGAGISVSPTDVSVNTDNSTIEIDGNDNLRVVSEGITANEIATGAVTTSEILDGTIQTNDIQSTGNNLVLTTDANGNVVWVTQTGQNAAQAGDGIVYDGANNELDVNPGDGIAVNNDQVEVVASDIEGNGVVVNNNNIDVNPGDGIAVNNDQVEVVASDIEGNGVVVNNNNIDVNPGDGIAVNNDQVEVNASDLDGAGTSISNNNINVNTDNSTIEIDGNDNLHVVSEGITANEIATGAVTSDEILDGTIQTNDIQSTGNNLVLTTDANGNVVWVTQTGQNAAQAGDGIVYDGANNELDVNPGDGIAVNNDQVEVVASDIEGNGLSVTNNDLNVNTDNSTIEINNDDLRVKAEGITANEIATGAITSDEILDGTIQLNDLGQNGAATGEVLIWNGSAWVPATNDDVDHDVTNELNTGAAYTGTDLTISDAGGTLTVDLSSLEESADIQANTTAINNNAANIATNANNIATNATNISNNTTAINNNATNIATNANNIATNATNISNNTTAINTNASNITTNAANIASNTSAINNHIANDLDTDATNELNSGAALVGNNLQITDAGGTLTVDLSVLNNTGTDDQNLTGATLDANDDLTIDIENGSSVTVDLSSLEESADIQANTNAINTNAANIATNANNIATNATNISNNTTAINTNASNITTNAANIASNSSAINNHIANDLDTDATNELNTGAALVGNNLQITDAGGTLTVDLSVLNNTGTDDQNLTGATLDANDDLTIDIENGSSVTVDLSSLEESADIQANTNAINNNAANIATNANNIATNATNISNNTTAINTNASNISTNAANIASNTSAINNHIANDLDTDATNELNTGAALVGNNLQITDAGGTLTVDLSVLNNTGTDDQNLTGATLDANDDLTIDIENGSSVTVDLSSLEESADIQANTIAINNNAANIATNANNIATNATNISNNTTAINTNASNITTNANNIATNATNISNNTTAINTNASNITTNANNIATNATNISNNTTAINTNASNISTNAANIASNTSAINNHIANDLDTDATNELNTGAALVGNNLQITDAGGTLTVDLSVLNNTGTDDQNLTGATLDANDDLTIDIENGSSVTVDLSSLEESADIQANTNAINNNAANIATNASNITTNAANIASNTSAINNHIANDLDTDATNELNTGAALVGNNLQITDAGGTLTVDLSVLNNTGTDDQNLTGATLDANDDLTIDIENGSSVTVDLSSLEESADIQANTTAINNNAANIATNANNIATNATNISNNTTAINTNASNISTNAANIASNTSATNNHIANDLDTDATNELNTGAALVGNNLQITDAGGTLTVDLSVLNNTGTDDQNLTGAILDANDDLTIDIENGSSVTVDLSSLEESADIAQVASDLQNHINADGDVSSTNELQTLSQAGNIVTLSNGGGTINVADNDNDPANEYNTSAQLVGNQLQITDGGGTKTVDLSTLNNSGTDDQNLSFSGTILSIEDGNSVNLASLIDDADADPSNEIQNLSSSASGTNRTINISGGTGTTINIADNDNDSGNELLQGVSLSGTTLVTTDAGGTYLTNLSSLINDADADPNNEIQTLTQTGTTVTLSNGGGTISVADNDNSSTNEIQALSISGSTISLSNGGGSVVVPSSADNLGNHSATQVLDMNSNKITELASPTVATDAANKAYVDAHTDADSDPTNEIQNLSSTVSGTNRTISISGGTGTTINVADNDNSPTNEIQALSIAGSTISLSNGGGSVVVPSSADNLGNHSATQALDMNSNKITELASPTVATDAANKAYVDAHTDADANPTNELQTLSVSGNQVSLSNGGGTVTVNVNDADSDPTNEIQNLTVTNSGVNRTINISGGTGATFSVADNDNSSSNELQTISKVGSTVTLSNGGGSFTDDVNDADADPTNELQTLSASGNQVTLSNGGGTVTVNVNDADSDPANEIQNLSSTVSGTNRTINISGGTGTTINVADNDNSSTNEIQALSISGSTISLSNGGGSVVVPSSADNLGNHSATQLLDMNSNKITELASPTVATDAANKAYVDAHTDADADPSNEIQNLSSTVSGTNRTINISGGTGTTISVADNDNSSTNELQTISKSGSTVTLSNGGGTFTDDVNDADSDPSNELQNLSLSGNTLNISGGTGVSLAGFVNTDNQNLSSTTSGTNRTINISGGTGTTISVADNDNSSTNEIQTLSITGNDLTISGTGGNTVTLPLGADNLGNHTATTTLQMANFNINNVGHVAVADPGAGEGIGWSGTAAGWLIDVSPATRTNADGDLNFYGTANNIVAWRPLYERIGSTNYRVWNEGNDGAGSGLDADLLDGQNGTYYLDNTDNQALSLSGNTLSLSNGGSVNLSSFAGGADNLGNHNATTRIQPVAGDNTSSGIEWGSNIWGGSGDVAYIRYFQESGENTKLRILNNNDPDDDIEFYQAGGARLNIYNGNVGINNTAPSQQLDVAGNSLVTGNTYIGATDAYFYRDAANRIATPDDFYVQATSGNTYLYSTNTYLGNSSGDNIHLRGNQLDWNTGILNTSGNLGLGTTSPAQRLHVVGNARISALAGSGNRVVLADANGDLTTTTIAAVGDNLGNHSATTTLAMNGNDISNVGDIFSVNNYGKGLVGLYSATRYQNVFAMGAAYRLSADGTSPGNLYGIAWTHSNIGGQSIDGLSHQALFMGNGVTQSAIGYGMWTRHESRANVFSFGEFNNSSLPTFRDGQFYRYSGQAELAVDDWFYIRDNDQNVRIQFNSDDGSVRPRLMYDLDNTAYYLDPSSSGTSSRVAGTIRADGLGGSGTRMVVADANGTLSTQTIPAGGNDNLGNHTATTNLNMNGLQVDNTTFYDVQAGNGNGLRFWQSDSYKIHMGNASEYKYGPVTDYSIKNNMNNQTNRGWTWGVTGGTPVAAISAAGDMQIAGALKFECVGCGSQSTTFNAGGGSSWGDLVIQGRVLSTNSNLHLSPPGGFDVIINNDYRAGGGTSSGEAGLLVEGDVAMGAIGTEGHGLNAQQYSGGTAAVRGVDQSGSSLYAEGTLGVLSPSVSWTLPSSITNAGVLGHKVNAGANGAGVVGINTQTVSFGTTTSFGGMFAATGGAGTKYGVYATASGSGTNYAGYFAGNVYTTGVYSGSDRKLKQNIQEHTGALELLKQVKTYSYEYKTEDYPYAQFPEGTQIGVIADEVQEVIPSLVKKAVQPGPARSPEEMEKLMSDPNYDPNDPAYAMESENLEFNAVNYSGFIPLLIEGLNEQQAQIDELKSLAATPDPNSGTATPVQTDNSEIEELRETVATQQAMIEKMQKQLEMLLANQSSTQPVQADPTVKEDVENLKDRMYLAELAIIELGGCCDKNSDPYINNGLGQGAGSTEETLLFQNHPNPFSKETTITYKLVKAGFVELTVVDADGIPVDQIVAKQQEPGRYTVEWDGTNFAAGVYTYVLSQNEVVLARKMILIKY
ncbi:MAG: tail fiber domain-containing protein [Bacteroidia bacterium]|nr:tail fiber domain-containing protein [Bacteroidia bacterium]